MKRIVLTGGPCGGKTTGKEYVREKLLNYGRSPIFVPEVATLIIGCGLNPGELSPEQYFEFQKLIFSTQMKFEDDIFLKAVEIKASKKPMIIMDRGLMDAKAYMTPEMFEAVLKDHGMDEVEARDKRYDGVFHLSTVADGKPELYSQANNPSRLEKTPEEAVSADHKTRNAWLGHPHLRVIDNSTDFDQKMNRLLNEIRRLLGDPVAIETERSFVVHGGFQLQKIPIPFKKIHIEQVYLKGKAGEESRIRRRSQEDAGSVYYETRKLPAISAASRPENEWQISAREYASKLSLASPDHDIVRKNRFCFLYKNQYFELDRILEPKRLFGLVRLEIELTEENDKVEIPDWLGKVEEVTGNPKWSNYELSRRPK
ncbi:MAG: AAA family ATPase [bacterium]|nr:AAA family ATPase [bacterium]